MNDVCDVFKYDSAKRAADICDVPIKVRDLTKVKETIKHYYKEGDCGCFFTRNWIGDEMANIYDNDGIQIDICYHYSYFEIFGLTCAEEEEIANFYESLGESN